MSNHLDQILNDPNWGGYGYPGSRAIALDTSDPEVIVETDIVARADEWLASLNLDYETYFKWADSKRGRWFADAIFGALPGTPWEERLERARKHNLTPETQEKA